MKDYVDMNGNHSLNTAPSTSTMEAMNKINKVLTKVNFWES